VGVSTVVPWRRLEPELLKSVIESFISREGTDYGEVEVTLDEKVAQVKGLLERREAFIVFDGETETVTIVTAQQAKLLREQLLDEGYDHGDADEDDADEDDPDDADPDADPDDADSDAEGAGSTG